MRLSGIGHCDLSDCLPSLFGAPSLSDCCDMCKVFPKDWVDWWSQTVDSCLIEELYLLFTRVRFYNIY